MTLFRRNQNFALPLLVLPFLSFGTMILVNYHNEYIARIVHYLRIDLQKQIKKLDIAIPEWSSARGHIELHKKMDRR